MEEYDTARQGTDGNVIRHMRFACWINKAIDTYPECVILTAFPKQWLRQRTYMISLQGTLPLSFIMICLLLCKQQEDHEMSQ